MIFRWAANFEFFRHKFVFKKLFGRNHPSNFTNQKEKGVLITGSSANSIASEKGNEFMDSAKNSQSAKVRAAMIAKKRIEGVLEKKMRLASMLNRRAFLRKFGSSRSMEATLDSMEMELNDFEKAIGPEILGPSEPDDGKSPVSVDLAARKTSSQNNKTAVETESHNLHSDEVESQEVRHLSVQAPVSL
jgi:hypothetical protein